jgi:hypothetical protein
MRKRYSKRRWKAKYLLGQLIPLYVISDHQLTKLVVGCELRVNIQMVRRRI